MGQRPQPQLQSSGKSRATTCSRLSTKGLPKGGEQLLGLSLRYSGLLFDPEHPLPRFGLVRGSDGVIGEYAERQGIFRLRFQRFPQVFNSFRGAVALDFHAAKFEIDFRFVGPQAYRVFEFFDRRINLLTLAELRRTCEM